MLKRFAAVAALTVLTAGVAAPAQAYDRSVPENTTTKGRVFTPRPYNPCVGFTFPPKPGMVAANPAKWQACVKFRNANRH